MFTKNQQQYYNLMEKKQNKLIIQKYTLVAYPQDSRYVEGSTWGIYHLIIIF